MNLTDLEVELVSAAMEQIKELKSTELVLMESIYTLEALFQSRPRTEEERTTYRQLIMDVQSILHQQEGILLYCKEKQFVSQGLSAQLIKKIDRNRLDLSEKLNEIDT